jgi:RNA polymerase sigma factor (TIGR02999 family)
VSPADSGGEITQLLVAARSGERGAVDRLFALVYGELRRLAHRQLGREIPHGTLRTTALVHEVYIKLANREALEVRDRAHFFALAARAMRNVLVDYARERQALKRGGGVVPLELDETLLPGLGDSRDIIELDGALSKLGALDERLAQLVELRFFVGLSEEEIGELLTVSSRTVRRDWRRARAFLHEALAAAPR